MNTEPLTIPASQPGRALRPLFLNMQVGMHTSQYGHYVTQAWRHALPSRRARLNLERIASLVTPYDLVALQEADAGSLRTASLNQVAHLALGRRGRAQQLHFLASMITDQADTVVLGDFNCNAGELMAHEGLCSHGLRGVHGQHTFPSWRLSRSLDHILVSPSVEVTDARMLDVQLSDHLPVAAELRLRLESTSLVTGRQ